MSTAVLIKNLQKKALFKHPIDGFTVLETHCSYVLLTGTYAYKLKKPVDFGFLNYSNLAQRKHFCEEEVARNQALAGSIYRGVIPIYGSAEQPSLEQNGEVIEYMVKMHEFPQANLLSHHQQQQQLTPHIIDALSDNLAQFHLQAPAVPTNNIIGSSAHAHQQTLDNFSQTRSLLKEADDIAELDHVQQRADQHFQRIKADIDRRKQQGFVKQCHGDVHLNNIVLIDDNPIIFDCIDFNDDFCWTDTMADLAFITMDLDEFGEHHFSWQLLNRYLEITGDYDGLHVLGYFQSYRAMVRAKVAMFTLANCEDEAEQQRQYQRYKGCIKLAANYLHTQQAQLVITSGVSASGKSTFAKHCSQSYNMIALHSDRERKRHAGMSLQQDCSADVLAGIYSPAQTKKTYQALLVLAAKVLAAGYSVIVDATFQTQEQRHAFAKLAEKLTLPFTILYCHAPEATIRQWLTKRMETQGNMSEANQQVLTLQLQQFEDPTLTEANITLAIDASKETALTTLEHYFSTSTH